MCYKQESLPAKKEKFFVSKEKMFYRIGYRGRFHQSLQSWCHNQFHQEDFKKVKIKKNAARDLVCVQKSHNDIQVEDQRKSTDAKAACVCRWNQPKDSLVLLISIQLQYFNALTQNLDRIKTK